MASVTSGKEKESKQEKLPHLEGVIKKGPHIGTSVVSYADLIFTQLCHGNFSTVDDKYNLKELHQAFLQDLSEISKLDYPALTLQFKKDHMNWTVKNCEKEAEKLFDVILLGILANHHDDYHTAYKSDYTRFIENHKHPNCFKLVIRKIKCGLNDASKVADEIFDLMKHRHSKALPQLYTVLFSIEELEDAYKRDCLYSNTNDPKQYLLCIKGISGNYMYGPETMKEIRKYLKEDKLNPLDYDIIPA